MDSPRPLSELLPQLGLERMPPELALAIVHRSYSYENGRIPTNERLEFLGDSVLGIVITDHLFRTFDDLPEGQLAKMRSAIVNSQALSRIAGELQLGEFLLLGRGEQTTGGREKVSILADALEAVIGAIYLDTGMDGAREFILRRFAGLIESVSHMGAGLDWKTSLQELAAEQDQGPPEYVVAGEGPDHDMTFTAEVVVGGTVCGRGTGRTKKQAEQVAAQAAFEELRRLSEADA